jgi:hypothetical protein
MEDTTGTARDWHEELGYQPRHWAERMLRELQPLYPGWEIWLVHHYNGEVAWCARPLGHPVATVDAWIPEHLIEYIAEQEAARETGTWRPRALLRDPLPSRSAELLRLCGVERGEQGP